jgi:hypothetical protein
MTDDLDPDPLRSQSRTTNEQVMQAAYPYIYDTFYPPPGPISPYQELIASLNADVSGGFNEVGPGIGSVNQNGGAWLGKFTCTNAFLQNLASTGTVKLCN